MMQFKSNVVAAAASLVVMMFGATAHAEGVLIPETFTTTGADGKVTTRVYGLRDASNCIIWAAPGSYTRTLMRFETFRLVPPPSWYEPLAATWANSQRIGGFNDWRLPTREEWRQFYKSIALSANSAALETPLVNPIYRDAYWTSDTFSTMVWAFRPAPKDNAWPATGIEQAYTRAGARTYVWPVRDAGGCPGVYVNPFATN
jgi:hypothetical protein